MTVAEAESISGAVRLRATNFRQTKIFILVWATGLRGCSRAGPGRPITSFVRAVVARVPTVQSGTRV